MANYALTTDGRSTADVEKQLRKYCRGWTYVFGLTRRRRRSFASRWFGRSRPTTPNIGAGPLLKVLGVADIRPVSMRRRFTSSRTAMSTSSLPRETVAVAALVPGFDWHLGLVNVPAA